MKFNFRHLTSWERKLEKQNFHLYENVRILLDKVFLCKNI